MNTEDISILLVEDNSIISLYLDEALSKAGFTVLGIARTGEQALELIEHVLPTLLIIDVSLEGDMNGVDLSYKILEQHKIDVIFATGNAEEVRADKRLSQINSLAILAKPLHHSLLIETIREAYQLG